MALQTEEFTTPSGEVLTLRGMSGFEVMLGRKKHGGDHVESNVWMLACAVLNGDEHAALEWLKTRSAGDFVAVSDRVKELSGLAEGADKSDVPSV